METTHRIAERTTRGMRRGTAVLAAALLVACGGGQDGAGTIGEDTATDGAAQRGYADTAAETEQPRGERAPASQTGLDDTTRRQPRADTVQVGLTEFSIDMPSSASAGPTLFQVTNQGSAVHSLEVEGQGVEKVLDRRLQPGESGRLQVDLQPGTYEVYCPVEDHAERGMRTELRVTPSGSGSAAAGPGSSGAAG